MTVDHLFHSWSAPVQPEIASAAGSYFTDVDGNRYLDLASQFVYANVGHQHPAVVAAIVRQAQKLCTVAPPFANPSRSEAARLIAERAPGDLNRVFFTNGGADAVENAVRLAKLHTGRPKVLAAYRSYHGNTATAIQLTGDPRRWPNEISVPGVVHFFGPYLYRSAFHATTGAEESERALRHLEQVIAMEGPGTLAAIVLETVPGTAGVLVPPDGYLAGVRELCDRYGILLIADEVMCGFGRAGEWFAVDRWGITPDLITFAKGVNSGYVPLGGVVISDRVAATFAERPFPGGLTYSGHPLACAAAVAALTVMTEEDVIGNARRIGEEIFAPGLREIADRHDVVGEVRGLGVFWAVELVRDRHTREPLVPYNASGAANAPMARVLAAFRERGAWPLVVNNRVHIAPPCTITDSEASNTLTILDDVLKVVSW